MRENIIFGSTTKADEVHLARSVALARLEQVVDRLPKGLSSRLGEQGNLLSGGERQRVAIARALYRGADILILDEATSSLDTLVEREIAESIEKLHGVVTTIIVSHRLGLVRDCDEIWVFDNGRLGARGAHDGLLESSDLYRRLVS
jgi:ATP-binding cassette subfamily C protein